MLYTPIDNFLLNFCGWYVTGTGNLCLTKCEASVFAEPVTYILEGFDLYYKGGDFAVMKVIR